MSFWAIFMGVLVTAVLLAIACKTFWAKSSKKSSRSEQYTLPVHRPQQHQPVSQPPLRPPPPSQSYRSSPYTPPVRQPEQHLSLYQPPPSPRPPPPSYSYQSSPYTPPIHQLEQRQPLSHPPPHRPPPSEESGKPEELQLVSQSPPHRPPPTEESDKPEEQYTPLVHQPEQHQSVYQPPPPQPPPSQSYRLPSPHRPPSPHEPPKQQDDNQQDHPNEYYIGLRARANKEGDEMGRCFSESRDAYCRGDRASAKVLSNQGKIHRQNMQQLNKEASNWIYLENNRNRKPGEIDLHGLYVKEAIAYTDAALEEAKLRGDSEIRLIVGRGLHSEDGEAKLRPAIKGLMRKYQLSAEFDPSNCGVIVVGLNGAPLRNRHRQHLDNSNRRSRRHRRRASNIGA